MIQMNLPFNLLANRNNGKTSAAKITIQKYYLPSGKSTQINGVSSDISIPSINMSLPIGESDLENALPNDSIVAVNFRKTDEQYLVEDNSISTLIESAKKRRIQSDVFNYLKRNIEFFKKRRDKKMFSLNLTKRIQYRNNERQTTEKLNTDRDNLSTLSYPQKNIRLDIVDNQLFESRKARGLDEERQVILKNL